MAEPVSPDAKQTPKSSHAEREERVLKGWKDKGIFDKTLAKESPKGEFVFYEGPPGANGRPHIGHFESRAFKDAIPRYKTMRGFHVRRKGGWDTHGLPVELQVEKELGFKSKKEIEEYGVEAFNDRCKEVVWKYVSEWESMTERMGYWVDLKDAYVTYRPQYIESLWNIVKEVDKKGLLYKDYKVVPWCPRCGTALSSHELAQGYETVKDLSVYAKFKVRLGQKVAGGEAVSDRYNIYVITWTTTPWTLPGNVGLAVGPGIDYVQIKIGDDHFVIAKARLVAVKDAYEIEKEFKGKDLVGLEYEPLYPFMQDTIQKYSNAETEQAKLSNAFKIYAADFVTTEDGTGIVHIAPMYGQDDFELGTRVGLPKYHLVSDDGTFKPEAGFLAGKFVKDEEAVAVEIIKNLAHRGLLFHKEKHEHTYPFCWRCKTPLIYFARDSWYIRMSDLRHKLVKENEGIHWEPDHIKDGRFGEWLREVKDWAISRERYWGTPLPVWHCEKCKCKKVVGSVEELKRKPKNTYYVMRHGEAENNTIGILSGKADAPHHLTEKGREQVAKTAEGLKNMKFDLVFASPFARTQETLGLLRGELGWKEEQIFKDSRLGELGTGILDGQPIQKYWESCPFERRFECGPEGGETYADIKKRMGDFLYELESKYEGKTIMIVTHETPGYLLAMAARGIERKRALEIRGEEEFLKNAEVCQMDFAILPHNAEYELDLHRPYIDEVKLACSCGGEMRRVKEVMDVWFDSGAMPFAQDHYPFEGGKKTLGIFGGKHKLAYPADFVSEAIDQTRGWFYTLHAIGALMGKGKAFKNVICLGHILDPQGKKMSKSVGNVVDPFVMMDKYGADALRFWMYSVNQPGDSKNFDEKTVDEVIKKVFNLAANVTTFYKTYAEGDVKASDSSADILDRWIVARLNQLVSVVTISMDKYAFFEPTRAIRDFIGDLSQWYLRRSRDRFKEGGEDAKAALATTKHVLLTLAKVMAPFTPFFAEHLYQEIGDEKESVHLEDWPTADKADEKLLRDMESARSIASKGLVARANAKINVRQPLSAFATAASILPASLADLISDELNVKSIVFDAPEDKLDTGLTPELKEEGDLRELLRKIQDLRKEKGLLVKDKAVLIATTAEQTLLSKYENEVKAATNISAIEYGEALGLKSL